MHNKFLISFIVFAFYVLIDSSLSFAQEEPIQEMGTSLTNDIISNENTEQESGQLPYVAILITAGGIGLGAYFTIRGLKISQRKTEADLFLRLNERLYNSEDAKLIINAMVEKKNILKINGGDLEKRNLENFLNEVQSVCILINHGVLSPEFAEPGFIWVLTHVKKNPEIMAYIDFAQKNNYGYYSWGEISMYSPKNFQRKFNYNSKINFQDTFQPVPTSTQREQWIELYNQYYHNLEQDESSRH
jgi:hypothetical protein